MISNKNDEYIKAFYENRKSKNLAILGIIIFMVVLFWIISPQEFNTAIRPLIIVYTLVHYFLFNNSKKLTNRP